MKQGLRFMKNLNEMMRNSNPVLRRPRDVSFALDWLTPRVEPGQCLGPDLRERRVKCGIPLSPQGADEPFFLPENFASLQVLLLGLSATEDRQQPHLRGAVTNVEVLR